jgi:hypothetical protein
VIKINNNNNNNINKILKIKYFEWKLMHITCLELRRVEASEWSADCLNKTTVCVKGVYG